MLQQQCTLTHPDKESSSTWGRRHRHLYAYGHAPLLHALWRAPERAGGLHRCKTSPSQNTIFSFVSLPQPLGQRMVLPSAANYTITLWSKAPCKVASSLSDTFLFPLFPLRCWDLPASPVQGSPEQGTVSSNLSKLPDVSAHKVLSPWKILKPLIWFSQISNCCNYFD